MDRIHGTMKRDVLLIYTQRLVAGRPFIGIGNLGTMTLAARLNAEGYHARSFTGITTDAAALIRRMEDVLLAVCFYCDFDNQTAVRSLLRAFQGASFFRLVGGPHTMHLTPEDASFFGADAILCGDGEESLLSWLRLHENGAKTKPLPEELNAKKQGEYRLLTDFSHYPFASEASDKDEKRTLFSVITARGCPHRCAFCFEGGNSKVLRPRPVDDVLSEIETRLEASLQLHYLFFADDTFTYDIRRLEAFNRGLRKLRRDHDFVWFCEGHAAFFKKYPDAVADMVDAGMVRIQIGMESGNDEILAAYGKGITAEDIRNTAKLCAKAHLPQLVGNFIIGGAFETYETLKQTRYFMLDLMTEFPGLLEISTTFPIPLPGTRLTTHPEEFGIIWDDKEFVTSLEDVPVNHTLWLSREEISLGRRLFISEMLKRMRELYASGRLSDEVIEEKRMLYRRYGIIDNWGSILFKQNEFSTT